MQVTAYPEEKKVPIKFSQNPFYTSQGKYLWIQPGAVHTRNIYSGSDSVCRDRLCGGFQYISQHALFPRCAETANGRVANIIEIISIMKSHALKQKAEEIKLAKNIGDEVRRAKLKKELPYITHSGVFIPRANANLLQPGYTYGGDIDNISNADEVLERIICDKQLDIFFACKSVSGNGVKFMLFLKELMFLRDAWTPEQYRIAYHKATDILADYFLSKYGCKIDTQMKAISQPFYLFYSENLFINKNLRSWVC